MNITNFYTAKQNIYQTIRFLNKGDAMIIKTQGGVKNHTQIFKLYYVFYIFTSLDNNFRGFSYSQVGTLERLIVNSFLAVHSEWNFKSFLSPQQDFSR